MTETLTVASLEFWLFYALVGAKFFVLGSIWGWLRRGRSNRRSIADHRN